ncbi:SCO family protein [Rhodohalobacter sp.]|uniref:SCO family protein n=1 Tax=Rhodohalobacter sp. TaxID=1974210 RepID=UPI00356A2C00
MFTRRTLFYICLTIAAGIVLSTFSSCDSLAVKESLSDDEFLLVDQDSSSVSFPEEYNGNIMLVGYVYTHCPDICPMITYNMRDVQRALPDQGDFMLVSVSFDPERDTPAILKDYADNYSLDQSNWKLLTGGKSEVESLLETLSIITVKTPTRFSEEDKPVYFIDHTDRVTLIDRDGNVRKHYSGSEFNADEVKNDILRLLKDS